MEAGSPTVIPNAEGARTTPSVVAYSKSGELLVGQIAKQFLQAVVNPENTFYSVKRFVGRQPGEVKEELKEVSYKVDFEGQKVKIDCPVMSKKFAPEEVSAQVLRKLSADAGKYLAATVQKAVVTVPAYFNDSQRQAQECSLDTEGIDLLKDKQALQRLTEAAEKAKMELSEFMQAVVNPENTFYSVKRFVGRQPDEVKEELKEVSYKVDFEGQKVKIDCPVMSKKFAPEEVSAQVLRKLSADAGKYLAATVQKAVVTVPAYFNDSQPDMYSVVLLQATKDAGKIAGLDVLRIVNEPTAASLAYGLEKKNNETILVFDLGGGTFDVSVLEVGDGVCEVLATNGDTHLGGDDFDKVIVDWLAEDFQKTEGIDLLKDKQALQRLTEAAEKAKMELSATDSQPSVEIVVLQGERQFAKDNKILGTFRLDGVPPAPRGVPQIEVTFDIDANGILNVGAKDRGTGKEQTITIAGSSTLDKTDVEKMVQDAEANAAEDEKRKEAVETKNNAESLVYQTEKQLQELGEKVPADLKASIDPKLQALKDKVGEAEPDTELLKTMTKDLQEELMKVGQAAYANTGASPPPGDAEAGGSPPPGDAKAEAKGKDDVIDVDGQ
eukprot:Skav229188  [mRNA]  locus=scaffold1004:372950:385860:- [translate_table: standard]